MEGCVHVRQQKNHVEGGKIIAVSSHTNESMGCAQDVRKQNHLISGLSAVEGKLMMIVDI